MNEECPYGFGKTLDLPFAEAVDRVTATLERHGFAILSRIDVRQTLEASLGISFRKYLILGACNSSYALQAFSADPNVGLLLPCNVVVYETEDGKVRVMAMDPVHVMELVHNPQVIEVGIQVKAEFEAFMAEL